ncbi:hypothetical protein PENTCL1PPCAC_7761, partial [Pristionchus entomophagus]
WRMEKVDIAEGAIYLIERFAGGSTNKMPQRVSIVFDDEKELEEGRDRFTHSKLEINKCYFQKKDRIRVEKLRRSRESQAIKKLKETLLKYTKNARAKMEKIQVLAVASDLLRTLAGK